MSECSLSLTRSWPSSNGSACLTAQHALFDLAPPNQPQARSMTYVVPEKTLGAPAEKIGPAGGVVGATGTPWGGVRCRGHGAPLPPKGLSLPRLAPRQHNA